MHFSLAALLLAELSLAATTRNGRLSRRQTGPVDPSTTPNCTYFTDWPVEYLDQGNTCASIASFWGISERAFIIWNPSVGSDCSNLIEGNSYCVEENGSTADPTLPVSSATPSRSPTPSSSVRSSTPVVTVTSTRPTTVSSRAASSTAGSSAPSPTQGGLAADCQRFYLVQSGDYCQAIVDQYGTFTLNQFYTWNPAVGNTCGGLQAGYYVCVGVTGTPTTKPTSTPVATPSSDPSKPSPTQGGLTSDCKNFYLVKSGDYCQAIVDQYGTFTLSQFYSWNPAIGNTCGGLQAGYYVCVGVTGTPTAGPTSTRAPTPTSDPSKPSPTQGGLTSDCKQFYLVQSGDYCQAIVDRYGTFTLNQFYTWNPAIGNTCGGLQAGYYVCVGVSGTPTTRPTSSAAPTPTGPQPQQPNVVKNCQRFYQIQDGDTCDTIINRYRTFTFAQFYSWNPDVGSTCGGLWLGYYVCVGIPGTPTSPPTTSSARPTGTPPPSPTQAGIPKSCNRYAQAPSGGTCPAFASANGISLANLYAWNPVLGSNGQNCQSSFWAGYYYCTRA